MTEDLLTGRARSGRRAARAQYGRAHVPRHSGHCSCSSHRKRASPRSLARLMAATDSPLVLRHTPICGKCELGAATLGAESKLFTISVARSFGEMRPLGSATLAESRKQPESARRPAKIVSAPSRPQGTGTQHGDAASTRRAERGGSSKPGTASPPQWQALLRLE